MVVAGVIENSPVAIVNKALCRHALRENHIMAVKLDMKIVNGAEGFGLRNGNIVYQVVRRHQIALDIECVLWRYPEIAGRQAVSDGSGGYLHRHQGAVACDNARGIGAPPNPFDRPRPVGQRLQSIPDRQLLDRHFAIFCPKPGTATVAGNGILGDQGSACSITRQLEDIRNKIL